MILKVMRAQRDEQGTHYVSTHDVESHASVQVRGGALFVEELQLAGERLVPQLRVVAHGEWVEAWTEGKALR